MSLLFCSLSILIFGLIGSIVSTPESWLLDRSSVPESVLILANPDPSDQRPTLSSSMVSSFCRAPIESERDGMLFGM